MMKFVFSLFLLTIAQFEVFATTEYISPSPSSLSMTEEKGLIERYNEKGELVGLIDREGNEISYHYDNFGFLTSVELPPARDAEDQLYRPRMEFTYNLEEGIVDMRDDNGVISSITLSPTEPLQEPLQKSETWDYLSNIFFDCFTYLQLTARRAQMNLNAELNLHDPICEAFEKFGKYLFGESFYLLLGPQFVETEIATFGQGEINDKARVTFINGILNTRDDLKDNLEFISGSHGGVNVHYVFRPTEGWTWDVSRASVVKLGYFFGFRSLHAHFLADLWHKLILEMGGPNGGGTIVHYAHSLGGTETARARDLLSPAEQKMIRVITFGSSSFVRNEGFQSVINHVASNDGVTYFGYLRYFFGPDYDLHHHTSPSGFPLTDHFLNGETYGPILEKLGEDFVTEFGSCKKELR